MIKYFYLFLLILLQNSVSVFGQGYEIELKLEAVANREVYLAHYYIESIFVDDTVMLDANGMGTFMGDSLLPQGLYKIYLDEKNHFDFLLGADQRFSISNSNFEGRSTKINGASESKEFIHYMHFLDALKKERASLQNQLKKADSSEKKTLLLKLEELNLKITNYWATVQTKYPDTFLARFLMANKQEILQANTLPKEIQENDSLLLIAKFQYQKKHFWDHFDYSDERFLYTPLLKPKIELWFNRILVQNYDSVRPAVFQFLEDVKHQKRIFQFAASYFLNESFKSKVMGMDALFVDLARKYYLNGDAYWASEESLKTIKENVQFLEHNLIGKKAPDLTLEGFDHEYFNLYQVDKKRTALLIYEPNCSHCKEFVPKLYDQVYQKYKDLGFEVFAIYSMDNKEEWAIFLEEHKLWDWINVWDKDHLSGFKVLYDARTTPALYLLDEDKTIIAKKISVEQMDKILEFQLK